MQTLSDMTSSALPGTPPPGHVLAAFGARGIPTPLRGGRGLAWRAGRIVVKPVDTSEDNLAWQRDVLGSIRIEGFRVSRPERSLTGPLVVDGWCASTYCVGRHEPGRWADVVAVGRRLHRSLEGIPRPAFISSRNDRWAVADRAAWGETPLAPYRDAPHIARLEASLAPVRAPSQLIHGDLTGNVLFADPLPPAIIDLSPYWRPIEFASAIVVADALVWEGAEASQLESVIAGGSFGQLLVRALLFRIVTDVIVDPVAARAHAAAYAPAVDLAARLTDDECQTSDAAIDR
jgi:uncharacterized protein (TIGR02569 family)